MNLDYEIEYQKDGEYEYLTVDFEAEPRVENDGIGPYEYWGYKGYDKGTDYVSLEYNGHPTWKKESYTDEENAIIEAFMADPVKLKHLEDEFIEQYCEYWARFRD